MTPGMPRYLIPMAALGLAVVAAIVLATIAHEVLGVPSGTIRDDAIAAVVFMLLASHIAMRMSR